jgi:hypothetical protein
MIIDYSFTHKEEEGLLEDMFSYFLSIYARRTDTFKIHEEEEGEGGKEF